MYWNVLLSYIYRVVQYNTYLWFVLSLCSFRLEARVVTDTISEKRDNDNNDMYQNYFKRLCTPLTCAFISPNSLRQFCHIVTGKDWSKVNSASLKVPSGYDSEPHRVSPALGIWLTRSGYRLGNDLNLGQIPWGSNPKPGGMAVS